MSVSASTTVQSWNPEKEIVYETYVKTIHIEAKTMIDMASKDILPAVIRYTKTLADTIASLEAVGADSSVSKTLLKDTSALLSQASTRAGKPETKGSRRKRAEERCEKAGIFLSGTRSFLQWKPCAHR